MEPDRNSSRSDDLFDPMGGHEMDFDDRTLVSDRDLIYPNWNNESLFNDWFSSIPGPLLTNAMCTYLSTQKIFIGQHWYNCDSCDLRFSTGLCSICALTCHSSHNIGYSKFSQFFCDCGAERQFGRDRCKALTNSIQTSDNLPNQIENPLLYEFMEHHECPIYMPWITGKF